MNIEKRTDLRFLVDVDDVLRNLCGNMLRIYNKEFNDNKKDEDLSNYFVNVSFPKVVEKHGDATKWFFQEHGHELFYGSDAINGAVNAINILKKYGTVQIVTKQRSTQNKIDTLNWLDKNEIQYDSVSFVKDKSVVCCDVFVDDYHENFINCGGDGAVGIIINRPYNKNIDLEELKTKTNFSEIVRYDSIEEFAMELDEQFNECALWTIN